MLPRLKNPEGICDEQPPLEIAKPLLTIAIPTYNRAWCLKELLQVLADQVKDEPRVELIICDNASPDETSSVVQDFLARGLRLRYIRNAKNVGPDANFLQCFELALGKYVWIFGDDDLIVPGGLAKILSYCEAAEYDLIWVSAYSFGKLHKPLTASERSDAIDISDPVAYVKRIHVFFTFITGNIINKDTVLEAGPKAFSSLVGTGLAQLGWTYTALNRFNRGLYIREPLIAMRINNTGGYKLFQVFGSTLATITRDWLGSANLCRIVMNGTIQRFWPSILLQYKKNASAFADKTSPQAVLTPLYKGNIRYWIFAYPVIVLPSLLAAIWILFVRIVNRLDKAAGFPMLYWRFPGDVAGRTSEDL
jgi:glycosyltransferase involved in cell wall biosynthesis